LFRPKGRAITIYLSEKESKVIDVNPSMKKSLLKALVQAKDDFFQNQEPSNK